MPIMDTSEVNCPTTRRSHGMGESVPDGVQRVIQSYGWCGLAAGGEQAG